MQVAQSSPTLCNPMDYTVDGILQARILEWVAYPFSGGSSRPRNWTRVSCIAGKLFTNWAIREAHAIQQDRVIHPFSLYNHLHLLSYTPPPPHRCRPQVCSLSVCYCFIDMFMCIIFDSIYTWYHLIFVFLTEYGNLMLLKIALHHPF